MLPVELKICTMFRLQNPKINHGMINNESVEQLRPA